MQRRKVWVSVGAAVFVTSQVAAPSKSLAGGLVPGRPLVLAAQGGEGGEGGEAGAAYDATLPRTLRFFRNIQLIRGFRGRVVVPSVSRGPHVRRLGASKAGSRCWPATT